jgi:site-specific DNA-methyltransferase (adenine-specific)
LDEEAAKLLGERSRFFYCAKASKQERNAGCEDLPLINSGMSNGAQTHGDGYDKGRGIGLNRVIGRKNIHPCVKPLALARHLATLLLPPTSVAPRRLLVPFLGSGSEMIGAMQAGWDEIVGIEQDFQYCEIAKRRVNYWRSLPPESPEGTEAA